MLLSTVLHDSLYLGVKRGPSLLLQQNQVTWRAEMRWERPCSPVVLRNITNFLFKRISNITIIAGAGISIRLYHLYLRKAVARFVHFLRCGFTTYRSEDCITQKIVFFLSISVSSICIFLSVV